MAREKKGGPGAGTGLHAKDRHKRDRKGNIIDWTAPLPPGLVARQAMPQPSSKHKSWFELMENKGKKKKLEFQVIGRLGDHPADRPRDIRRLTGMQFTESIVPPPGFEFVPAGNPALTTKCKELSREQEAMIFIVTVCRLRCYGSPTIPPTPLTTPFTVDYWPVLEGPEHTSQQSWPSYPAIHCRKGARGPGGKPGAIP